MSERDAPPEFGKVTDVPRRSFWNDERVRLPDDPGFDAAQVAYAEQVRRPLPVDDCSTDACKALAHLGYAGLGDEVAEATGDEELTDAPDEAWRRQLEAEGKATPGGTSLRELMEARSTSPEPVDPRPQRGR